MLFAVTLVVFLGIAALVVDYGYLAVKRRHLQNVADAAALAAAWELPDSAKVEEKSQDYALLNAPELATEEITTTIQNGGKEVKVDVEHEYDTFFAKIWGNNNASISATATAEKTPWAGEALPFINLEYDYSEIDDLGAWGKLDTGLFGSIWKNDRELFNEGDPDRVYFKIKYEDGLEIQRGVDASIKGEMNDIFNQGRDPVYMLSLKSEVIQSNKVWVKENNNKPYEEKYIKEPAPTGVSKKLGNKDIIRLDQLVLLKISFDNYDFQGGGGESLEIGYYGESYDLSAGEYPEDYVGIDGRVRLIE